LGSTCHSQISICVLNEATGGVLREFWANAKSALAQPPQAQPAPSPAAAAAAAAVEKNASSAATTPAADAARASASAGEQQQGTAAGDIAGRLLGPGSAARRGRKWRQGIQGRQAG